MEYLSDLVKDLPLWQVLAYCLGGALVLQFIVLRVFVLITGRTKTTLDETIVRAIRTPLFITLLSIAVTVILRRLYLGEEPGLDPDPAWTPTQKEAAESAFESGLDAWQGRLGLYVVVVRLFSTIALWLWFRAVGKISDAVLEALARKADDAKWIEPRTLPLFELLAKLSLFGGLIFLFLKTWNLDPSAWLASAGILGLAIGFAAKDTLANLFAGLFIIADAPYQIGEFIRLGTGERGKVTDIGLRSTRILTRDDIEVTIPNSVMANTKIVNETQGPAPKRRVRIDVGIAYGADLDAVKKELLAVAKECEYVLDQPPPSVRVRAFADSSITVQLRGHIPEPVLRGRAIDALHMGVHKRLREAGIEIPFPQRVVYVHRDGAGA